MFIAWDSGAPGVIVAVVGICPHLGHVSGVEYVIETRDLAAGYGGGLILDGVNMSIEKNCITCIIGGSGCGKSTLLKAIVGQLQPVRGTVTLLGHDLYSVTEDERADILARAGLMFQYGALLGSLTLVENLEIPIKAHTRLRPEIIRAMIEMKLGLVYLSHALHRLPGELSGGMRKRAGLARAIVLDPDVVMCDEPTAGLDPITAAEIDELILKLRRVLGMTVIVVTHELSSIRHIADRIVMLQGGKLHFHGTLDEALASTDPALTAFFGRQNRNADRPGRSLLELVPAAVRSAATSAPGAPS